MIRIAPILIREKIRCIKKMLIAKPILVICYGVSILSVIFLLIDESASSYHVGDLFNNQIVILGVMIYLFAKILNPTQGMIVDYQLIQLKLISLNQYKFLLGLKLFGGSIILTLFCYNSYTKMVEICCMMNVFVNVWVFLRNRWNSRVYDLFVALAVVVGMKFELFVFSLLFTLLIMAVFILLRRVNYEGVLSLYKLMYQIGQQRFMGVFYSENESQDIQVSAERLVGKSKQRNSDWCERVYDCDKKFAFYKELARLEANAGKLITNFIISVLIGISSYYLPKEYMIITVVLLIMIASNFDISMNRSETNLLLRGYIRQYIVLDIIKSKLWIYSLTNFILMLPLVCLGWEFILLDAVSALLITIVILYKCFKSKHKNFNN